MSEFPSGHEEPAERHEASKAPSLIEGIQSEMEFFRGVEGYEDVVGYLEDLRKANEDLNTCDAFLASEHTEDEIKPDNSKLQMILFYLYPQQSRFGDPVARIASFEDPDFIEGVIAYYTRTMRRIAELRHSLHEKFGLKGMVVVPQKTKMDARLHESNPVHRMQPAMPEQSRLIYEVIRPGVVRELPNGSVVGFRLAYVKNFVEWGG